jgi:molybdate/tungstate transport system substrate-binding protein
MLRRHESAWIAAVLLACVAGLQSGCGEERERADPDRAAGEPDSLAGDLIVFHAGSLSVPFRELSTLFEERHPGVTVKAEAAGSRDCARKVSDLGRECDVLGSADYAVIENLLMPEHAEFNILFATNEMAIAFTRRSAARERIDAKNWYEVLLEEGVRFGRSDPNRDPCGYRTVMAFQLAERHYGIPGLAQQLIAKHGTKYIRPKETDLLALLEAGEIDYLFIYRSVADQHELQCLLLPDEINLKSAELAELYAEAVVEVTGSGPGETISRRGAPMVYSVTIPRRSPNRAAAEAYLALLLSEDGRTIMERNGQPCLRPPLCDGCERLPARLSSLVAPRKQE